MAFGFGFNKQKVLNAAEKFVQQGKLQNAIAEYDKVIKADANDLTVNNTIGDLYARLGDNGKAIECFKKVGDAYAAQGFTVKGIAMYKKITKIQPSVDGALKLAELYTQQGLFNDARAQYLQVAEDFLKKGDLEQAVRLFQKVLEMDPENVPMRIKLAEVYVRLGKKKEAWEIFGAAAEALRAKGSLAGAEDILKRMQTLDPGNGYVLLLRGKAALEADDAKSAIGYLEKAADLDSHPEGLLDLLKAYLQVGSLSKAGPIAEKLLTVHNDPDGLFLLAEGSTRLGQYHEALEVYTRHADRLLATDSTKLLASLHSMITHVRDDSGALDAVMLLLNKAGESTHINEVTELLAHASVKDGNLSRARDLYQMLATTESQNPMHMQNYQQVVERMEGTAPAGGISAEEGAVIVEELEATAAVIDQSYPDDVAIAVRSAVTDADLFLSYNLPEKATVPLLGALPLAPRDARLNQRLAALHTRFLRFTEAAVCCRTLESVYHDAGQPDDAVRYGDLAARYEMTTAAAPVVAAPARQPDAAAPSPWPVAAPAGFGPKPTDGAQPQEFEVAELAVHAPADTPEFSLDQAAVDHSADLSVDHSVDHSNDHSNDHSKVDHSKLDHSKPDRSEDHSADLSNEWEASLTMDEPAALDELPAALSADSKGTAQPGGAADASSPEIAETVEEVRFYLEHFMTDQARAGLEKLERLTSDAGILGPLRAELARAGQPPVEPEPEIAEINADEPADEPAGGPAVAPAPFGVASAPQYAEPVHAEALHAAAAHAPAEPTELTAFVADLEAALGDSFPQAPPPAGAPAAKPLPGWPSASPAPLPAVPASAGGAAAAPAPAMSYSPAPVRPLGAGAQAMHPSDSIDLSEMFGELKHELEEEVAVGDEDPETHYNLGVAFREMGLLDEAIAELQKVCNSIERGVPFNQPVQTYTWLAQCFLDKGVPQAAIRWYEKALTIPGLDGEASMAIRYELGSACETAADKPAALRHFTSVYGSNIDYRDVAERIQALKS